MPPRSRPGVGSASDGGGDERSAGSVRASVSTSDVTPLPPRVPMASRPPPPPLVAGKPVAPTAAPVSNPVLAFPEAEPSERRVRRASFAANLPAAGRLLDFEPARIIGWAVATGYTGCLWLAPETADGPALGVLSEDGVPHRDLYLEGGALVAATSTVPGDGLLEFLGGLWSRPQAQRARAEAEKVPAGNLKALLDHLCQVRLIDRQASATQLAAYLQELLRRSLKQGAGRYRLLSRMPAASQRLATPLPLRRMIVEGLRRSLTQDFLFERIGLTGVRPQPIPAGGPISGGAALLSTGLSPAEERALRFIDGRHSLIDIMTRSGLSEHATYVLVYALVCMGAVSVSLAASEARADAETPTPAPSPPAPSIPPVRDRDKERDRRQEAITTPPLPPRSRDITPYLGQGPRPGSTSGPGEAARAASGNAVPEITPAALDKTPPREAPARVPDHEIEAAMRRVQEKFIRVENGDYFTLLELPFDATPQQIDRSYEILRARFQPSTLPYRCRTSMDRELRQIAMALDEARQILTDDTLREAYRAALIATSSTA